MSDKAAGPTLLQRAVMWILNAAMFYVVALYPVYLMARFEPDDIVHYGFLRWMAVVLVLYWAASQLLFTERPSETRTGRMLLAVTAAVVLAIGVFSPIVSFSFIGDVDYFREGYGDGYILLLMALLSVALAVTGRWKQVLIPALGSLAVILWTFLGVQDTINQARTGGASELTGNPHEGLAASVMQSIQWEWGWVLLFAGSGLLVYSAARRDQWEAASPPLVSVAVDDEPEAAAAAATGATETEAEIEPDERAAAAPTDDAALASAMAAAAGATTEAEIEADERAAAAPTKQAEAAEPPAEPAEETAAAPPEALEPAAQDFTEETPAPAQSVGAEEQETDETEAAAEVEASAQQPEPQPAEPAAEPDPQPEDAADGTTGTAPATSADETEAVAETAPEEKAPAATRPADGGEAAPAPAGAPAEAAPEEESESAPAEESESAPAEMKKTAEDD